MTTPDLPLNPDRLDLTVRTEEDVLALPPLVLGFHPTHSVVMLTFGAVRSFHARVDLPATRQEAATVAGALVEPARRHGVRQAALVLYGEAAQARPWRWEAVVAGLEGAGVEVVGVWWCTGGRVRRCVPGPPEPWRTLDLADHPFVAAAVLSGRVTRRDRAELAALLAPDPVRVAEVAAALGRLPAAPGPEERWNQIGLVATAMRRWADEARPPQATCGLDADDRARLLTALMVPVLRDEALVHLRQGRPRRAIDALCDLVRSSPAQVRAGAAGLLAWAAWQSGDGALAWCAVDTALAARPGHRFSELMAQVLVRAIPPEAWAEIEAA
ncbi:DUF4192 domain-containing protein [Nocardioides sp.]|uniref:DUF4192 domain-containing protein n=1 Tax=Nocardioides sp. TaxID=35761 RepID=UPI0035175B94